MYQSFLLNRKPYTVIRPLDNEHGFYNENGEFVPNSEDGTTTPQNITIRANVQPPTGQVMKLLDSGFKRTDVRVLYTATQLRSVNEDTDTEPDYVIIDGYEFQVQDVEPWQSGLNLNHYKYIVAKVEKSEGDQ